MKSSAALRRAVMAQLASGEAVSRDVLTDRVGSQARRIREAVNDLIALGNPIVSNGRGLLLASDADTAVVEREKARLKKLARSVFLRVARLERITPRQLLKQMSLEWEDGVEGEA